MIRIFLHIVFLLFLFSIQVSFVHSLPYPFDRIPLVLIVTIYLYQYKSRTFSWWWVFCYGLVLDVLSISQAPLEAISYAIITGVMMLLVAHVFTNKSFYSMAATSVLCLVALTISEFLLLAIAQTLVTTGPFLWQPLLWTNVWAICFACLFFLFVIPSCRRGAGWVQRFFLDRF